MSAEKENTLRSCPIYVSKWKTHILDLMCLIQIIISAIKTVFTFSELKGILDWFSQN